MRWEGSCGGGRQRAGTPGAAECGSPGPGRWEWLRLRRASADLEGEAARRVLELGRGAGTEGGREERKSGVSVRERLRPTLRPPRPAPPHRRPGTDRYGAGPRLGSDGGTSGGVGPVRSRSQATPHRVPRGPRPSLGSSLRTLRPASPPHPLQAPGSPRSNARRPLPVTLATAGWGRDL